MALLNDGFDAYIVRGEGLSGKLDDLVTYIFVTCDDKIFVAASECMTHRKVLRATITFSSKVRGVNVITCT